MDQLSVISDRVSPACWTRPSLRCRV